MLYFVYDEIEEINKIIDVDKHPEHYNEHGKLVYNAMSGPYNTVEEAYKLNKVLEKPCVVCGGLVATHYQEPERMIEKNMCFFCNLWDKRSQQIDSKTMIVEGEMYTVGQVLPKGYQGFKGFGGSKFIFKRFFP